MKKILTVLLALTLVFGLVACEEKEIPDDDRAAAVLVPGDNGLELLQNSDHFYIEKAVEAAYDQVPEDAVLVDLEREGDKALELTFLSPTEEIDFAYDLPAGTLKETGREASDDADEYALYKTADVTMLEVIGLAQAQVPDDVVGIFKSAELEEEDGQLIYDVTFAEKGTEYSYLYAAVRGTDATTGATTEEEATEAAASETAADATASETEAAAATAAEENVLAQAIEAVQVNLPDDAVLVAIEREDHDLLELKYETPIEDHKYIYNITNGEASVKEVEEDSFNAEKMDAYATAEVTLTDAVKIAESNLPEGVDARFEQVELDVENGRLVYEVEFEGADSDYEFVIDAVTGDLIK